MVWVLIIIHYDIMHRLLHLIYLMQEKTKTPTATIGNTGTITATTFSGSGASLTNIPYTALTGTAPFYTKTEKKHF